MAAPHARVHHVSDALRATGGGGRRSRRLPAPLAAPQLLQQHTVCVAPTTIYAAASAYRRQLRVLRSSLLSPRATTTGVGVAPAAGAGAAATSTPPVAGSLGGVGGGGKPLRRELPLPPDTLPPGGGLANVSVTRGTWRLYEDRLGKPGWTSTGPNGSAIEFDVRFGKSPRLTFAYTLGYEGFASVTVGFAGLEYRGSKWIDGMRSDGLRVTQAATLDMAVGHMMHGSRLHLAGGVAGWAIRPYAVERFRVELRCASSDACGKFKILGIRAC